MSFERLSVPTSFIVLYIFPIDLSYENQRVFNAKDISA